MHYIMQERCYPERGHLLFLLPKDPHGNITNQFISFFFYNNYNIGFTNSNSIRCILGESWEQTFFKLQNV